MLKLASKRPLEQWSSPAQCSPHRRLDGTPSHGALSAMGKRMRAAEGSLLLGSSPLAPGACPSAFVPAPASMAASSPQAADTPHAAFLASLRKRARRANGDAASQEGAGGSGGSVFFRPAPGPGGAAEAAAAQQAAAQSAAAAHAAHAATSAVPEGFEDRLFSLGEVRLIVAKALEAREGQLRAEYDRLLAERLQQQFESFSRYHEDYLSRQLRSSDFSYMS